MKSIINFNNINNNHLAGGSLILWFILNISTLILNKYIYSSLYFYYPITLTAIHMLLCWVGSVFLLKVYKLIPFVQIQWSGKQFINTMILSILFCSNIVFGNVSLRWVPVSFMQTVKSSVPLFTVILTSLIFNVGANGKKITFSRGTYLSMIPIVGGVCIASLSEVNFNQAGFIAALISSILSALFAILSGVLTQQMNVLNLLYYMSPISIVILLPLAAWNEFPLITSEWIYYGESKPILILLASGIIAFLLNTFTFLVIKLTSPLTYTVSGNLKVVLSITISILVFKNETNFFNILGGAIALIGIAIYSSIKYEEGKLKQQEAKQQQSSIIDSQQQQIIENKLTSIRIDSSPSIYDDFLDKEKLLK